MILILSNDSDEHAITIGKKLNELSVEWVLLDLSKFPKKAYLSILYNLNEELFNPFLNWPGLGKIDLKRCGSIWWRRPQPFDLSPDITDYGYQVFALNECSDAFEGLWESLDTFWINNPIKDQVAHRKSLQLKLAKQLGLKIPKTIITNSPEQAKGFIQRIGHGKIIYKAFSATDSHWRETRLLKSEEYKHLDTLEYAPVIFQEYIHCSLDLRITVVGDRLFAAAIHSQETAYKVDFRMDIANANIEPFNLPQNLQKMLTMFMNRLGLVYGAIDMRLTPDGEFIFLEINPAGQWLFIEERTGQEISSELAKLLAEKDSLQ